MLLSVNTDDLFDPVYEFLKLTDEEKALVNRLKAFERQIAEATVHTRTQCNRILIEMARQQRPRASDAELVRSLRSAHAALSSRPSRDRAHGWAGRIYANRRHS